MRKIFVLGVCMYCSAVVAITPEFFKPAISQDSPVDLRTVMLNPDASATTSFDAMWMGVPVVTLAGDRFLSRMGTSMAINLGLEQLVAQSADQYVDIAVALAGNTQELVHLRSGMRARMEKSALVDANRFTLHLEQAYREMWTDWCARVGCGLSPQ